MNAQDLIDLLDGVLGIDMQDEYTSSLFPFLSRLRSVVYQYALRSAPKVVSITSITSSSCSSSVAINITI